MSLPELTPEQAVVLGLQARMLNWHCEALAKAGRYGKVDGRWTRTPPLSPLELAARLHAILEPALTLPPEHRRLLADWVRRHVPLALEYASLDALEAP